MDLSSLIQIISAIAMTLGMAIYLVMGTWERLGILVFRDEIATDAVDDAFSGRIIQSWINLVDLSENFAPA